MFQKYTLQLFIKQNAINKLYPWITAISGLLILMVVNGLTTTSLTVFDKILEDTIFGGQRDELKYKDVITSVTYAILVAFSGIVIDRFRVKSMMLFGIALLSITLFCYSFVETKTEIYIAHFFLGMSLIMGGSIPTIILVSTWFKKHKGISLGIALAGTSAGGIIFPQIIRHFMEDFGWRTSFQLLALFPLVLFIFVFLVIKNTPSEIGSQPWGETNEHTKSDLLTLGVDFKDAIKTSTFWLVCLCGMFGFYSVVSLISNTYLYVLSVGFSATEASYALSLYFLIAMLGKILISSTADYVNKFWLIRVCFIGLAFGSLGYALLDKDLIFWAIGLTALSWGGMFALYNIITIATFGLKDAGKINGVISLCEAIGSFSGPAIAAILYMVYHSYQNAFLLSSFLMFLATILSFFFKNEMKE